MTRNINFDPLLRDNNGILGLPVALIIIVIIVSIILSFFAVSSGVLCSTVQNESVESTINQILNLLSTMESFSHEESSLVLSLSFPSTLEHIVFGDDSFYHVSNKNENNSFQSNPSTKCIYYKLKNGYTKVIHSPISFYDDKGNRFVLQEGTYSVKFSLQEKNNEVSIIAQII